MVSNAIRMSINPVRRLQRHGTSRTVKKTSEQGPTSGRDAQYAAMSEPPAVIDQDGGGREPPVPPLAAAASLGCRAINPDDLDEVVALLGRGFPERDAAYWWLGFARHRAHPIPEDCPALGFLLRANGRAVGVVLTLYGAPGPHGPRCNLSSWYVEPAFRPFATLLDRVAMRRREVTFTNISAAPHTVAMHVARGFAPSCRGQFFAIPACAPRLPGRRVTDAAQPGAAAELPAHERQLLADHTAYGCVCVVGHDETGAVPFVFVRHPVRWLQWKLGRSPLYYLQLVYCRSLASVTAFARPLGRHLLRHHATAVVALDADGVIPGLPGRYVAGMDVRLARGPDLVRAGDLSYSELVIFGA